MTSNEQYFRGTRLYTIYGQHTISTDLNCDQRELLNNGIHAKKLIVIQRFMYIKPSMLNN